MSSSISLFEITAKFVTNFCIFNRIEINKLQLPSFVKRKVNRICAGSYRSTLLKYEYDYDFQNVVHILSQLNFVSKDSYYVNRSLKIIAIVNFNLELYCYDETSDYGSVLNHLIDCDFNLRLHKSWIGNVNIPCSISIDKLLEHYTLIAPLLLNQVLYRIAS